MKKSIFLLLTGLAFGTAQSQEITDALRYSQDNTNGTARYRAMSGAFGALGGDLSSLNINPAGSAVFANNQVAFTLNSANTKNNSDYFGSKTSKSKGSFDLNQAGGVFVFKNQDTGNDWKKFSVAINYENANNFDNSTIAFGTNPNNSIDKYFLSYANADNSIGQSGIDLGVIQNTFYEGLNFDDQQALLGYYGYVLNPIPLANDPNNFDNPKINSYNSNIPATGGKYLQKNIIESIGNSGNVNFNVATSYKDKLFLGINLNSHFVDYRQTSIFLESNNNSQSTGVRSVDFQNDIYTQGTGFSFQLGAILKVTDEFRAGLAYESATWMRLTDMVTQNLSTVGFNYGRPPNPGLSTAKTDSNVDIEYQPYKLQTPGKWTASLAYVFGKKGLISLDYGIKDYSNTNYTEQNDFRVKDINSKITTALNSASDLCLGAEYKIEAWSLRAGYRYEQSPYKNKTTVGDLTGYSGGLGYNWGATKLDLAYSQTQRTLQQGFFNRGFTDSAKINAINSVFTVSLVFEL
jgi:long-subunit fatty acid transport protein